MRLVVLLSLFVGSTVAASELGADGRLHLAGDALLGIGFESDDATTAVLEKVTDGGSSVTYTPLTAAALDPLLVTGNDSPEGQTTLHVKSSDGIGFAIIAPTLFAQVKAQRIVVTFWGRAEGMEPALLVTYDEGHPFLMVAGATVFAVRTGRETSDGWVEYSTNAIDGSVVGRPIHDITILGRVATSYDTALRNESESNDDDDAFSVDAIEIDTAPGAAATATCTALDVDASCGAAGECMFGRCVDSAAVWQPIPPVAMQREIVARFVHYATHLLGDRQAAAKADSAWVAKTLALASATATPRTFFSGLNQQIGALRDSHTSLGAPDVGDFSLFTPHLSASSGPLDVCFGPTLNDLGDGKLAFVVWTLGSQAVSGMSVGDVLTAVDGMEPMAWLDQVYARYDDYQPADPRADWAARATRLSLMLSTHAGTVTMTRCTGGTCTALPPLDVASVGLAGSSPHTFTGWSIACDSRFTDVAKGARSDSGGGDAVVSQALDAHTAAMEFDGFSPSSDATWRAQVDAALALPHDEGLIIDAREGYGGENELGAYLIQQLVSTTAPAFLSLAARGTFDQPDDPSLTAFSWTDCGEFTYSLSPCNVHDIFNYAPTSATPPGATTKIAWLDTDDLSNNEMVARVVQGRAGVAIFGPVPSYGVLGSDIQIPPLLAGWTNTRIGVSDGRYGATAAAAEATTTWQSGTGVVPDQIVTQTLSDVLAGKDTIVLAARAWLAQ